MKLVRFIRIVRFADAKIFKLFRDFLEVFRVSFLFELESIKNIHRVFRGGSQKDCTLKLRRFFVKPARNAIILELAFNLFSSYGSDNHRTH